MKKFFSFLLLAVLFVTGCGNTSVNLDLDKISSELDTLSTDKFYMQGVSMLIDETTYFEDLKDVYDYEFKELFGLDNSNISEYSVRMNKSDNTLYMLLKPTSNDVKDTIKGELKAYFDDKDVLETEYEGYLIYIVSSNNEEVLDVIKSSKDLVFYNLMPVEGEMIESTLGISNDKYSEILMKLPMAIVQSNMYVIVKPADGMKDDVKSAIDEYMVNLEEQWKTYLPDQYELVKNRKYEEYGGYLIYIVSNDNDKVFEVIKNNEIKG